MMGASDINGFIPGACQYVLRYETSNEGDAGTVDAAFLFFQIHLCPFLGNYVRGEPRSVVFMDNASTGGRDGNCKGRCSIDL